jgi:hypothetical protein
LNGERINSLVKSHSLRICSIDKHRIKSVLEAAREATDTLSIIPLNEKTSSVVFKTAYDALRQLGDVKWLLRGYEARTHEVSMEILMEEDPVAFKQMDRFRIIRNDAVYRGFKISVDLGKEILALWNEQGTKLLEKLREAV